MTDYANTTHENLLGFHKFFTALPELQPHLDAGAPVMEYFVDCENNHHFCFRETRIGFAIWNKFNAVK